ncbi:MAG: hypothetical protein ACI9G1_003066 [Pirellulaceae bacterium]|jgi:hypothetical protein
MVGAIDHNLGELMMNKYKFDTMSLLCFAIFGLLLGLGARLVFDDMMTAAPSPDAWWNITMPLCAILFGVIYSRTSHAPVPTAA